MSIYRRGGVYWISYYVNGKRVRESVGTKEEARVLDGERAQDRRQGRNPALRRIKPILFEDMVAEYLESHVKREGLDLETVKQNTDTLLRFFRGKTLQSIAPRDVEDMIAARLAEIKARKGEKFTQEAAQKTTNRQRATLSGIFKCAIKRGRFAGENPVKAIEAYDEPLCRFRYLTGDEAEALVAKAARHLKPIILTALYTGGRLSEVLSLKWDAVDLKLGIVTFLAETTKGNKKREIPLDPRLEAALRGHLRFRKSNEHLFTWGGSKLRRITTAFTTARKKAGLGEDVTFHVLRHTFASWFMMNGGDIFRLKGYMGHSDIKLTERYAHLSPTYRRAGVAFFGAPVEPVGHNLGTNAGQGGSDASNTSA